MEHNQSARVVLITPLMAEEMLLKNNANRPLLLSRVETYAKLMRYGDWRLNGETIVFADDGTLMTGQHRLHAVLLSGVSILSWVITGVPREYFPTMDSGAKKSASDILSIAGEQHTALIAAAAVWIPPLLKGSHTKVHESAIEIQRIIDAHPDVREWARYVNNARSGRRLVRAGMLAVFTLAGELHGREIVEDFVAPFMSGENLARPHPAFILRERILAQTSAARLDPETLVALTIQALMAWVHDRPRLILRWRATVDEWPRIY